MTDMRGSSRPWEVQDWKKSLHQSTLTRRKIATSSAALKEAPHMFRACARAEVGVASAPAERGARRVGASPCAWFREAAERETVMAGAEVVAVAVARRLKLTHMVRPMT